MEDVCITLIDKTDTFIPTKREDYWGQTLKTLAPHGLKGATKSYFTNYSCVAIVFFNTICSHFM